jgi:hypothetical protein
MAPALMRITSITSRIAHSSSTTRIVSAVENGIMAGGVGRVEIQAGRLILVAGTGGGPFREGRGGVAEERDVVLRA